MIRDEDQSVKFSPSTDINITSNEIPSSFTLHQNFPNPFNPVTKINFDVPANLMHEHVKLTVYNMEGKIVETLINQNLSAGSYQVEFDGNDLASGSYLYQLLIGGNSQTKKMVL